MGKLPERKLEEVPAVYSITHSKNGSSMGQISAA